MKRRRSTSPKAPTPEPSMRRGLAAQPQFRLRKSCAIRREEGGEKSTLGLCHEGPAAERYSLSAEPDAEIEDHVRRAYGARSDV